MATAVIPNGNEGPRKANHQEEVDATLHAPLNVVDHIALKRAVIGLDEADIRDSQVRGLLDVVELESEFAVPASTSPAAPPIRAASGSPSRAQLTWTLSERPTPLRFLIRDRDSKFTRDFDAVFRSEGIAIIQTPVRAPTANAIAERFVRTIRAECLDWLLIMNRRHLERVLVEHYNSHRPHRSLNLEPPNPKREH